MGGCNDLIAEGPKFAELLGSPALESLQIALDSKLNVLCAPMEDDPYQLTEAMRDGPDRLAVAHPYHQASVVERKDAALGLLGCVGSLAQQAPHHAVAFGRTVALGNLGRFFTSGTNSQPGG